MTTHLLTTKTYIPLGRPNLIPRPHLIERLNAGLARKLTLLSAPAGFGKTTLISEWTNQKDEGRKTGQKDEKEVTHPSSLAKQGIIPHPSRVAWFSLDSGDNDPARFWRYVIAALQTVESTLGETLQTALESSPSPSLESLVTTLANDLTALSSPLVLVLDDYHLIDAEPIHRSLNFLLDHMPPQLHLVITTRADPPLSLPRRRGRSEVTEIRATDLCFTLEEAARFLNTCMGLDLSPEDIATLDSRTEGWIAGLQMAALSLQTLGSSSQHDFVTTFAGDDRYIVDYLLEEVFQRQPPPVQKFLLRTSILEQLCGSLGNAVTGRDDAQAVIDYLEQTNLFVMPLDNRRHWYRYHHLFANLLRQRLSRTEETRHIVQFYLRASDWYEREGFIIEAVDYALASDDFKYAADLIERHVLDVFYRSEIVLVYKWLKALPEDVIRTRPLLSAVYGSTIAISETSDGSLDVGEQWLQHAETLLVTQFGSTYHVATGFIAKFRAYMAGFRGAEPQVIINLCRQALDILPEKELRFRSALAFRLGLAHWHLGDDEAAIRALVQAKQVGIASGDLFNTTGAIHLQTELTRLRGKLHEAATLAQESLPFLYELSEQRPLPYIGRIYITLGDILYEWNDLEEADRAINKGAELIQFMAPPLSQMMGYIALARLRQAQGDIAEADDLLGQAERAWPKGSTNSVAPHRVRLWLTQVEENPRYLANVIEWARQRHLEKTQERYSLEQLVLARVLVTQIRLPSIEEKPDLPHLLTFLTQQTHAAQRRGWTGWMIEALILQSLALLATGTLQQAIAPLERALTLAEPEGYVRIFVDEGPPMEILLRYILQRGIAAEYVTKLLAAFRLLAIKNIAVPPDVSQSLLEPLSPREIEVLQCVAAGLSNPKIAQKLFISIYTVKKHITNIYGKLEVTNRSQAITRARELGLAG